MFGNSSLMADKDMTFFGEKGFTGKEFNADKKDGTKNSSNPEKVYKELNQEISKICDSSNINKVNSIGNSDLSSSNSRNNDITLNDQLIDPKIWSINNETQDSNQYFKKYEYLKNKNKEVVSLNKTKKPIIKFIPNNNYDYSADTDEFGFANSNLDDEELSGKVNKISSIQMKNNNINQIDKNSLHCLSSKMGQLWVGPGKNRIHQNSITEPDEFYSRRTGSLLNKNLNSIPHFGMPMTPQKRRQEKLSINLLYGNNLNNQINFSNHNMASYESVGSSNNSNLIQNFPRMIHSASVNSNLSTQYSSNNKKKRDHFNQEYEEENERSMEILDGNSINEDPYINPGNTQSTYQQKSERKIRVPTSESIESNHSAQFNYLKNYPQIIGVNLNTQFSSGGNYPIYIDEEPKKSFSSSFNENNYMMNPSNFESAFSLNNCFNSNHNLQIDNFQPSTPRQKVNKHTKSENFYLNDKYGNEKNLIIVEDILMGRDKRTTVMIRNIPIKYSDEMLLKELDEFKGKFDCLYLPYDYEKDGNRGYAFINFIHPFNILLFHHKFEGKTWNLFESKKICELNSAKFQGINEIKKHANRYKGFKKPSFFFTPDIISNLEIPLVK